jgi:hypothetical protein
MKSKGKAKTTQQTSFVEACKAMQALLHSIASVAFSLLVPASFALGG